MAPVVHLIPEPLAARAEAACRKAVSLWGAAPQFRMAQEECAELIAAINRLDRGRAGSLEEVLEEIADASLCLLQLRLMLGGEVETHHLVALYALASAPVFSRPRKGRAA